jgi:hypothetical protein
MTGDTVLAALALCPAPPKMRPSRGVALPSTCATALNARKSAAFFAQLSTVRGETPRHVAPLRRFYKRVARRAERREGNRIDVDAALADVTCDYCGSRACTDFYCGMHDGSHDEDVSVRGRDLRGVTVPAYLDEDFDFDADPLDDDAQADFDARAWRYLDTWEDL